MIVGAECETCGALIETNTMQVWRWWVGFHTDENPSHFIRWRLRPPVVPRQRASSE